MTVKLKVQKREGPLFAADLDQLKKGLKTVGKERVILAGQLMLCSLEALKPNPAYVIQPSRTTVRNMPWQSGKTRALNVSIDKEALGLVVRARQKPVFAVDALLRYGQRLKGSEEFSVIGVFESVSSTQVVMLQFRKAELVSLQEFALCASTSHTFESDLHTLLERLRMASPQSVFHWCGPLTMPASHSFTQAPATLWLAAPAQNLTLSGKPSVIRRHGVAVVLALVSAAAYGASLYIPYTRYVKARDALTADSSQMKGQDHFATERLTLLRARQAFFEVQKNGDKRLEKFKEVLAALADQKDLRVRNAKLNSSIDPLRKAPPSAGRPADFEVMIEVPRTEGVMALAQSQPLLQDLSAKLAMNLRLATSDAYRDVEKAASTDGTPHRQYRIQGDFNHAP